MNELQLRDIVVNTARSYLGYNVADGSHKKIVDIYNSHQPLARSYKVKYTDQWCATFVSAVSILCGFTDIMPTECGCEKMISLYKALGRWEEDESITPSPGDVAFYDWDDSGADDDTGFADHVGIVEAARDGLLMVIEGNFGKAVKRRVIELNAKTLRGYGRPDYASIATDKVVDEGSDEEVSYEQFKDYMKQYRKELQDNDAGTWSAEAREWATQTGLVKGSGDAAEFNGMWEDMLTREQMAVLLYRFAQRFGLV